MSEALFKWACSLKLARGPKAVLKYLAGCHTVERGCFPTQRSIGAATVYSESSVNNHLSTLEASGLINRRRRTAKGKQTSTIYEFPAFQAVDEIEVSDKEPRTPVVDRSSKDRSKTHQKLETKKHQKLETINNPDILDTSMVSTDEQDELILSTVLSILSEHPFQNRSRSIAKGKARRCVKVWTQTLGFDRAQISEIIKKTLPRVTSHIYSLNFFDEVMIAEKQKIDSDKLRSDPNNSLDSVRFFAEKITSGKYVAPSAISTDMANTMIRLSLVTHDELRRRGVAYSDDTERKDVA